MASTRHKTAAAERSITTVHPPALARDLTISIVGAAFALWVTFASGYQSVYQAMLLLPLGLLRCTPSSRHAANASAWLTSRSTFPSSWPTGQWSLSTSPTQPPEKLEPRFGRRMGRMASVGTFDPCSLTGSFHTVDLRVFQSARTKELQR